MDFILDNLPLLLVFAGTVALYTLALIQMAILRRRETAVARAVVKMLSFQLDESEKNRTGAEKKLLEASRLLGEAMPGLDIAKLPESELLQTRGW